MDFTYILHIYFWGGGGVFRCGDGGGLGGAESSLLASGLMLRKWYEWFKGIRKGRGSQL